MAALVVIPARLASTRFPRKILAAETGRPLVQHVVDQVKKCQRVRRIIVAADHQSIIDALAPFGTAAVLTSPDHQSGTDRVWEVAREHGRGQIIVNVQGDEPEIEPQIIDDLVVAMEQRPDVPMATAATPFPPGEDPANPNLVKAVFAPDGRALYFSRAPIPFPRDPQASGNVGHYLHLGLYAYRWDFLQSFTSWPPSPLEQTEKLEQLRALEHGAHIHVIVVQRAAHGIDTPEQYQDFIRRFRTTNHQLPTTNNPQ